MRSHNFPVEEKSSTRGCSDQPSLDQRFRGDDAKWRGNTGESSFSSGGNN